VASIVGAADGEAVRPASREGAYSNGLADMGEIVSRNDWVAGPSCVQFDRFESLLLRWIRVRLHAVQHQAGHRLDLERESDGLDVSDYRFTVRKFRFSIFARYEIYNLCHALRSPCLHVMHFLFFDPITDQAQDQAHKGIDAGTGCERDSRREFHRVRVRG
jgi:hypothetical protein